MSQKCFLLRKLIFRRTNTNAVQLTLYIWTYQQIVTFIIMPKNLSNQKLPFSCITMLQTFLNDIWSKLMLAQLHNMSWQLAYNLAPFLRPSSLQHMLQQHSSIVMETTSRTDIISRIIIQCRSNGLTKITQESKPPLAFEVRYCTT